MLQELAEGVKSQNSAWRFIRKFAENWAAPLRDDDGWGEGDLDLAEKRLGVPLPGALREAYQLLGRRSDLTSNHDVLLSPAQLHLDDRGKALVFRHENQGSASWGVLITDLRHPDPTVFIRANLAEREAERWDPWLSRLSLAFIEVVLSESLHAPEELCDFLGELDDAAIDRLQRNYTRLPFPEYPICQESGGTRWFTGPDVLLRDDERAVLWVRARANEALDQARNMIPGEWLND